MHYCGINDHNQLNPIDPFDLFHRSNMYNFQIKIGEKSLK